MMVVPADKCNKEQCKEMMIYFDGQSKQVNAYKRRLCEIYDFEQNFLDIDHGKDYTRPDDISVSRY